MKWSKYNYLFKSSQNKYLLYNSVTNNFIELTNNQYDLLNSFSKQPQNFQYLITDELIDAGVFVEDDKDLYYSIKLEKQVSKYDSSYLSLTVVPTSACNFDCTYCYEVDRPDVSMNNETEEQIIEFIKDYTKIDRLRITWYGGEPLLAFERIASLTSKIKALDINYDSYMITNGYLLNEEVIDQLDALSISGLQITIDGLEATHNKRRPHLSKTDSFQKIIENLGVLFAKNKKVKVALRVNIDKTNEDEYHKLYRYLTTKFNTNQLNIHPGYITNIYSSCSSTGCEFDRGNKKDFVLKQFRNNNIPIGLYPSISIGSCTARHINSFVIGARGELYKCWNDLGIKEKEIGNLHTNEQRGVKTMVRYLVSADPLDDVKCQNCFLFPLCNGGCPYSRIKNEFDDHHIDCCHIAKNNLKDFLELHYENKINHAE